MICNSNIAVSCPSSDPTEVSPGARPRGDDEIKKILYGDDEGRPLPSVVAIDKTIYDYR